MMNLHTPIRLAASMLAILLIHPVHLVSASQKVISADGREVLLDDDGSWSYLSKDRIVNTEDGKQVRLKEDGSWLYIGNSALDTDTQVRTTDIDLKLDKVVIETYQKKVQKNTRIRTQTVFYVDIKVSPQSISNIKINSQLIDNISVADNNGKEYSILSVSPHTTLQPGAHQLLTIRVDKSPSILDDAKSLQLVFSKGTFNLAESLTLSQKISDFYSLKVDGFEH